MTPVVELNKQPADLEGRLWLEILANNGNDTKYQLPAQLRMHEAELEVLMGKVFRGRSRGPENIDLARQMYLNWCLSKSRQLGITFDAQ
ncbi:MAG: hypothetical protein K2Y22_09415 [Candidatus Obscuribacterales bacterium]|nr:hypothetical protein [Candidatus Obscuribacterales bacterium]